MYYDDEDAYDDRRDEQYYEEVSRQYQEEMSMHSALEHPLSETDAHSVIASLSYDEQYDWWATLDEIEMLPVTYNAQNGD